MSDNMEFRGSDQDTKTRRGWVEPARRQLPSGPGEKKRNGERGKHRNIGSVKTRLTACVKVDAVDTRKGEKKKLSEMKTFQASTMPLPSSKICVQMRLAVDLGMC